MPDVPRLLRDHDALLLIAEQLGHIVAQPQPPTSGIISTLLTKLADTLVIHLKAEDWIVYPSLLGHKDPVIAATARRFTDEMGSLADAYGEYRKSWNDAAIAADWSSFCRDTDALVAALTKRIARENADLYPLLAGPR